MKNYIIFGVLLLVLIAVLILSGFVLIKGFEYKDISVMPLLDVIEYTDKIEKEKLELSLATAEYNTRKTNLEKEKENYADMKSKYENVSQEEIDTILEAYKKYKYDLEWLWITLGNYARTNNLQIVINEPENPDSASDILGNLGLTVRGRYLDIVDFVFDIENDKELLFKLDNMNMTYDNDNKIVATFDILTMNVIF